MSSADILSESKQTCFRALTPNSKHQYKQTLQLSGIHTTTTLGMGRDDKNLVNRAKGLQLKKFMNHWLTD